MTRIVIYSSKEQIEDVSKGEKKEHWRFGMEIHIRNTEQRWTILLRMTWRCVYGF